MNDFFSNLFEWFGGCSGQFYNDMYQQGYYQSLGIIMFVITLIIALIYYYFLNHPRFNHWWHWLIVGLVSSVLNALLDGIVACANLIAYFNGAQQNMPYTWDNFFVLSITGFFWSFVLFFVLSFILKWRSRNCKHSPFL